jgi:hypothetical protein
MRGSFDAELTFPAGEKRRPVARGARRGTARYSFPPPGHLDRPEAVAAGTWQPHTAVMTSPSPYRVPLDALEATAHVAPEDLVESVDEQPAPPADSRGEQPDRDWFAAGG